MSLSYLNILDLEPPFGFLPEGEEDDSIVGNYATKARLDVRADLESMYGPRNIAVYSNLDNDTTEADNARIQFWLDRADALIDRRFGAAGRTVPIAQSESDFEAISDVAAEYAGASLYFSRGSQDGNANAQNNIDGFMQNHLNHALAELDELIAAWSLANPTLGPYAMTGFVGGAAATVDKNGVPVPSYRGPAWDPYRGFVYGVG